ITRINTDKTRRQKQQLSDNPLDLDSRVVAEVDEEAQPTASRLEVVVQLGFVFLANVGNRFEFHDDCVVTEEVRRVRGGEEQALVVELQRRVWLARDALCAEFDLQGLLIDSLQKPTSKVVVDLEAGPSNLVGLVRVDEF